MTTLYDLWERPQIKEDFNCKGTIALNSHCSKCPKCVAEAKEIVLKYRSIPGRLLGKPIVEVLAHSMVVLLIDMGSMTDVSKFIRDTP